MNLHIRPATPACHDAIWAILHPIIEQGETYALPRDMDRAAALVYWFAPGNEVFVAEAAGQILGTYLFRANQKGGGAHVANCGYMTAPAATGKGIAYAMCQHSLQHARDLGFRAMQFNFVVSTNTRAVALWQRCGFQIIARLPGAFLHPSAGYVDALVMFQNLINSGLH